MSFPPSPSPQTHFPLLLVEAFRSSHSDALPVIPRIISRILCAQNGVLFLYMKTIERAHSPANLWEKIQLSKQYSK